MSENDNRDDVIKSVEEKRVKKQRFFILIGLAVVVIIAVATLVFMSERSLGSQERGQHYALKGDGEHHRIKDRPAEKSKVLRGEKRRDKDILSREGNLSNSRVSGDDKTDAASTGKPQPEVKPRPRKKTNRDPFSNAVSTPAKKAPSVGMHPRAGRSRIAVNTPGPRPTTPGMLYRPTPVRPTEPPKDDSEEIGAGSFTDTAADNLSTFAVDIDNASYIQARSYMDINRTPPPKIIREEEFVNSFKYNYPAPRQNALAIFLEAAPNPLDNGTQILRVGIKGKEAGKRRKNAVLTFVVDVSGSMRAHNKLPLVKKSLKMLVNKMQQGDRIGIVIYGASARLYMPYTGVENKQRILNAIDSLRIGGSTNVEAGLLEGYKAASQNFQAGSINRIFLLSDGVANVGRTSAKQLVHIVKKYKGDGIYLSTIGYGMGEYNDHLMENLGNKGDGYYAYVNNVKDAERLFGGNLASALEVIARDVKIQVQFNPKQVESYRLIGYKNRAIADHKFRDDREDGGEIGPGHEVTALYEMKMKYGVKVPRLSNTVTVNVRYKHPNTGVVKEISKTIIRNEFKKSAILGSDSLKLAFAVAGFAQMLRHPSMANPEKKARLATIINSLSVNVKKRKDVAQFANYLKNTRLAGKY